MEVELSDKQKEILEVLRESSEELATSKIAFLVSSNIYHIEPLLNDMELKNIVVSRKKNNATYWRIRDGKKEEEGD